MPEAEEPLQYTFVTPNTRDKKLQAIYLIKKIFEIEFVTKADQLQVLDYIRREVEEEMKNNQ